MYDMKKLADLVKSLEDQLVVCMRCGMCQAVCPLFAETGREADVARGKLSLLDGLIQGMFKDPEGVNERLTRCLLCGSCAANCPSGVKVLDIFFKARVILTGYMGLSPVKKVIFRGMLAHPKFFDSLSNSASKLQKLFLVPADDFSGLSCARFSIPALDRRVKALAPVSFHSSVGRVETKTASGLRAGFFVGCMIDKVYTGIGHAVLSALEHNGVGIFLPEDQGCCGMPALASGDIDTFRKLVRYNLERFQPSCFDFLVTACATCTSTIKKLWPQFADYMSGAEGLLIKQLAEKTMDISEFLVERANIVPADSSGCGDKILLTYHDPCHLKKSLGIAAQPRTLIRSNPAYVFREMNEPDRCCGCGGSFNVQYYPISASIGRRKRDAIIESGCSTVATSCPACMLQISDMLSQAGQRIQVKHVVEIYAESISP
ncbi:MAG: (Fe-S)-binding protein [Deltaproteobacteria bacterium]|nr:(Fe-S)-binding protein [Deltaproteobacteria bacterium]